MVTARTLLLGLLDARPAYGYELKKAYDERFAHERPVQYGQIYSTLSRLLRDGMVEVDGVEPGGGPDRKRYAITAAGVTDVEVWLAEPVEPRLHLHNATYAKMIIALLTGRNAHDVLDVQRAAHMVVMRELTERRDRGDLVDRLVCDHALLHLDADLRWLEQAAARVDELASAVTP